MVEAHARGREPERRFPCGAQIPCPLFRQPRQAPAKNTRFRRSLLPFWPPSTPRQKQEACAACMRGHRAPSAEGFAGKCRHLSLPFYDLLLSSPKRGSARGASHRHDMTEKIGGLWSRICWAREPGRMTARDDRKFLNAVFPALRGGAS